MTTTDIDAAMDAAFSAALLNPQNIPETPVAGHPNMSVRVARYNSANGSGFRVMGRVKIGSYTAIRVRNHGPDTASERDWPNGGDIAGAAALQAAKPALDAAEQVVQRKFSWLQIDTLQDLLASAKETETLAARHKLVAVYEWMQTVKSIAMSGSTNFPPCPHGFEEVVAESAQI